ncbi:hypothetical protein KJ885_04805 [Patescibacteria group bacterium]|nr:hypothetical protein [Patescibacteria group bacterium]
MNKLLQNLKNFLDFLPGGFIDKPDIDLEEEELTDEERKRIVEFGKKAFPYIYAYGKVFNECCRLREEIGIHNSIKDEGARKRFDKFLKDGGDVEKIKYGKVDEEYLSGDDIEKFKKAEAEVHKTVHCEVRDRIEKVDKEKFNEYVEEGKKKVEEIEEKIGNLRRMAGELPEYASEINQKIKEMEERWVNYSNEPQAEDLNELLEYYNSIQL